MEQGLPVGLNQVLVFIKMTEVSRNQIYQCCIACGWHQDSIPGQIPTQPCSQGPRHFLLHTQPPSLTLQQVQGAPHLIHRWVLASSAWAGKGLLVLISGSP